MITYYSHNGKYIPTLNRLSRIIFQHILPVGPGGPGGPGFPIFSFPGGPGGPESDAVSSVSCSCSE